ncbi:MAG: hypothetical protein Ct9H90mP24_3990 [Methanobacteriota archaeon]|nr:MAG: hypothetical protein Ct9H90mP24_3990 [Euryarchaeota archaeon]
MKRCGIAEVSSALESEEFALILALRESKDIEGAQAPSHGRGEGNQGT